MMRQMLTSKHEICDDPDMKMEKIIPRINQAVTFANGNENTFTARCFYKTSP
jgi:hypothetical protein